MLNITLGTAGHIDHGKTALVKALTGCETDRLKEEKERGMSIDLGFAPCRIADLEVGIVDVPGHENFIKTMVAGASGMDGVILVVAADDGIMPQTREHLDILTLLGVRHGLVALTKIDRVDAERRQQVAGRPGRLPPRHVPRRRADPAGVERHRRGLRSVSTRRLETLVQAIPPKRVDGVFRLPLDRAFSAQGLRHRGGGHSRGRLGLAGRRSGAAAAERDRPDPPDRGLRPAERHGPGRPVRGRSTWATGTPARSAGATC